METGRREVSISRRQFDSDDKVDSPNLRDYLRIKEDESNMNLNGGQTLGAVLSGTKLGAAPERVQSNRTLLDIIRDDPQGGAGIRDGKKSWRHFKDKLRLRRQGSGSSWTSSVPIPTSDVPINQNSNRIISRRDSLRFNTPIPDGSSNTVVELTAGTGVPRTRSALLQRNTSRIIESGSMRYDNCTSNNNNIEINYADQQEEAEEAVGDSMEEEAEAATEGEGEAAAGGSGGQEPVRMSLLALLAETDRQMGIDGGTSFSMEEDEDEEEEEEEEIKGGGREYNNCCVCMVRHKGAAFIPCGHTFCRLCSRELWVQRGNCPLCNNFILEILDIF